jgi:hypothetical protein
MPVESFLPFAIMSKLSKLSKYSKLSQLTLLHLLTSLTLLYVILFKSPFKRMGFANLISKA